MLSSAISDPRQGGEIARFMIFLALGAMDWYNWSMWHKLESAPWGRAQVGAVAASVVREGCSLRLARGLGCDPERGGTRHGIAKSNSPT